MWYWIVAYLIIISMVGWVLPYIDKKRAEKGQWRVRESTLFAVSILGGSAAMLASMKRFHHKTKHKRFMIGIPCIIAAQLAAVIAVLWLLILK